MFDFSPDSVLSPEEQRRKQLRQMVLGKQQAQQPDQDVSPVTATVPAGAPVGLSRVAPEPEHAAGAPAVTMMPPEHTTSPVDELMQIGQSIQNGQRSPMAGPAPAPLTGSRAAKANAEAYDAAPAQAIGGFWRRLAAGANKGLQTYREGGGPQTLGGLIGAVGGGAGYGAASPGGIAEWAKQRQSGQLWQRYGQEVQKEGIEEGRNQAIAKTAQGQAQAVKAGIDAQQEAAKPYLDSVNKKGYMLPDEVDHLKNVYGIDVTDPNNGRFVTTTRNGKTYIRRINEPVSVEDPTTPTELGNEYYDTQLPGQDQKVPLKPGQVASTAVGIAQANAGRDERAGNQEAKQQEKAYETAESFKQRQTKARATAAAAQAELTSSLTAREIADENGTSTAAADARIAKARGDLAAAQESLKEKYTPPPASAKPQAVTEVQIRAAGKSKGKTAAQIEEAIRKARDQGLIQ